MCRKNKKSFKDTIISIFRWIDNAIEANAEMAAQMKADFEAAKHKAPNGKEYTTAHAWKFNSLLWDWKKENPMENNA